MCLYVKQVILTVALLILNSMACQAADARRQIYLAPGVEMAMATPFAQALQSHGLWQLPLAPDEMQVVRLLAVEAENPQPFYWMQTRLDEQQLSLKVKVGLEIWSGAQLRWQRVVSQSRSLRLMGPEMRGVGQPLLPQLARLPQGALTAYGLSPAQTDSLRQQLWQASFYLLHKDYQRYTEQSEREMSR
ncbi:MAG: hypothetical protein IGS03_03440 [Candidatus Sericytochromatia bacterium]|nr:hypothetical protein [Candidatus Sericytochromatia bacterium]